MEDEDADLIREELMLRLARMRAVSADMDEVRRQLHSVKGLAQAYGFRRFADAAHALEDRFAPACEARRLDTEIDTLARTLAA